MWLSNLKDQNGGIRQWNNLCKGKIVAAPGDMGRLTNRHVIPNPRIKWQCNGSDRVRMHSIWFSNSSTNRTENWTYGLVQHKYKTLNWTKGSVLQKFGSNRSSEPNFDTTSDTKCAPVSNASADASASATKLQHHGCRSRGETSSTQML